MLRRYNLFSGLFDPQLERLLPLLLVESHPAETIIVREGQLGNRMWCIVDGQVEVSRGHDGGIVLARLGAGETIGEMELIDMQPRSSTVTALTPCVLYSLLLRDLINLQQTDLPTYSAMILNVARDLSRRLRQMDAAVSKM